MATPMQYEMINRLFQMSGSDAHIAEMVGLYQKSTLVDVSNVWRAICASQDDPASIRLDETAMAAFIRPFEEGKADDDVRYPMPWPLIAMTCSGFPDGGRALWFVGEDDRSPGFGLWSHTLCMNAAGGCWRYTIDESTLELPISRAALALCAAKNASWVESLPDRATRRRNPRLAGVRFRHIDIDMGRPKSMHKTADRYKTAETAWHHRRGHWAFYGPEKPLFGRKGNDGWYWRPYTEVGDKQYGEIVQDYSVTGNLPADGQR